eukprot:14502181-Alexandrium_andersonii.AAC.1
MMLANLGIYVPPPPKRPPPVPGPAHQPDGPPPEHLLKKQKGLVATAIVGSAQATGTELPSSSEDSLRRKTPRTCCAWLVGAASFSELR